MIQAYILAAVPQLQISCYRGRMTGDQHVSPFRSGTVLPQQGRRLLAEGQDWCVCEYVCASGPGDQPFEERREQVTIAAVLDGIFRYTSDTGSELLHPGSLLLGNHGTCFECGHDHSTGDRCVAFHISPDYFGEVAASAGGTSRFRFPVGKLPIGATASSWLAGTEVRLAQAGQLDADEAIVVLIQSVVGTIAGMKLPSARLSPRDEKRIGEVVRYIDAQASEDLSLDQLARIAQMSKYHFLRTFQRIVGTTPYQFLLNVRLRRAAVALQTSSERVSSIAFAMGFGDLSTFNAKFKDQFGQSPNAYRATAARCTLRFHGLSAAARSRPWA